VLGIICNGSLESVVLVDTRKFSVETWATAEQFGTVDSRPTHEGSIHVGAESSVMTSME